MTTTTSQSDALGRLVSISYDDGLTPNKNYFYDAAAPGQAWSQSPTNPKGMLVATSSGSGTTLTESQFSYDLSGNVTTLLQCAPSICNGSAQSSRVLGFGYDLGGNLTASFDPAAGSISYTRSTAGEVTTITNNSYQNSYNPPNLVSNVVNTPFGPSSYALGNGVQSVRTYDSMGRSNGIWACTGSSSPYCTNGSQLWGSITGFSGVRLGVLCDTVLNQCEGPGYDEFNRLTSVSDVSHNSGDIGSYTFTYDRWGNRLSQTSQSGGPSPSAPVSDTNNQISGIPYDVAGNMESDGISHTFTYDAEGNILAVDGGNTAKYVYDALNHRVSVQTQAETNEFTFDPFGRRISTWATASNFGIEGRIYWDGMQIAYRAQNGQTFFQRKDYLGTNRIRTNYQGTVAASESSLAFGDAFNQNVVIAGSDQDNDQFAGQEKDAESSSEHAQFRQYSSTQGRWMSPDPYDGGYDLSNPQSLNRYTYALNNPLSFTDSSGLDCDPFDPDEPVDDPLIQRGARAHACEGGGPELPDPCPPDTCVVVKAPPSQPLDPNPPGPCDYGGCILSGQNPTIGPVIPSRVAPNNGPQPQKPIMSKVQKFVCKGSAADRVFASVKQGAIVGGVRGAASGFIGGEIAEPLGGGIPGALLGGFLAGTLGAAGGVFTGSAIAIGCSVAGAYGAGG